MFHPKGPSLFELTSQALSSTDAGYDLLAPKFDYTPFRTPDSVLRVCASAIGGPGSVATAADFCCGTGAMLHHLRPLARERVVGIDRSEGMLAQAKTHANAAEGAARVECVQGDVLALDASYEAAFDVVTCFGAFGHIEEHDEPRFVESVRRALKPGGRFVFVTGDPPPVLSRAYLFSKGFNAVMRVRNLLPGPPFIMYYLTFMLPRAKALLEAAGFELDARRNVFDAPFDRYVMVVATKK